MDLKLAASIRKIDNDRDLELNMKDWIFGEAGALEKSGSALDTYRANRPAAPEDTACLCGKDEWPWATLPFFREAIRKGLPILETERA